MAYKSIVLHEKSTGDYFYEEAIKTLRTNLQFSGKNNKVILLTSSYASEGKSDTCFNLAKELGKAGKKVLLIDADIRKSVYKSRYDIQEDTNGLSQYLSGQIERIDDVVYKTNFENLYLILAGPYAPNPTEILGDEQFGQLLKAARQVFEYVLVDTPPLGAVIDAAVISQFCDGAAIVVESGVASRKVVRKVKEQLEKSGCKVLGVILNKMDINGNGYYGSKYRRYYSNKRSQYYGYLEER